MNNFQNNIQDFASKGIANGINIVRKAVEGTIGGAGKSVLIRKDFYPYYISTKDAFSIIQAIKCNDPLERQAVDMMRDATDSMNKIAKDGRTAMCILTDAILQGASASGKNPMEVEKEINDLLPFIEAEIDKQTKKITVDDIESVARTASNNDRVAKVIGEIYKKQGKECIINHIEASGTHEDYVVYHEGVRFQGTGFISESLVHDEDAKKDKRPEKRAVYENPVILVTKRKISTIEDIDPLLKNMEKEKQKDLIVFTDDMDSNVATMLVNTHKAGIFNICIIKAPVIWKQYVFEDFAKCVGATIVEDATGVTFKNLALNHLGTCGKIIVDKDECILTGIQDISEHIRDLKKEGSDDSLRRVWWLTTKTATMRLGANNEGELSNIRLAAQDAVYSCQAALEGGIVAGGGVVLKDIARNVPEYLQKVLLAPFIQICLNGGLEIKAITFDGVNPSAPSEGLGINAKTRKFVNMFDAGIVDSALVIKNSIRNAVKIASIILKTDKLIDIPKLTLEEAQIQLLMKPRDPFNR